MMVRTDFTREELVAICERAIVPEGEWSDRDSCEAHEKVGACWALLKAGCRFEVLTSGSLVTDAETIWLSIWRRDFYAFEVGSEPDDETFYLPTPARLERFVGKDWY